MQFDDLKLHPVLLEAVRAQGYTQATPIQAQAIPHVLAGKDVLASAQTGTGKTASFALPILHRLITGAVPSGRPSVLVLVPTRELAVQVTESFNTYGGRSGKKAVAVYGGVSQHGQVQQLRAGVDVVVAAPGRLLDLMDQRLVQLSEVRTLVLDEADRMLDMGFIVPIRKIVGVLPRERQNLMFSATMPDAIRTLAHQILRQPAQVSVAPVSSTTEAIEQRVRYVEQSQKFDALLESLADPKADRVIVFTRTKHGADRVVRKLQKERVGAAVIHGNRSQSQRQKALDGLKSGVVRVLVATDVAARGIDVDNITHVINYDLPNEPESYVHRIGRTARAGASGLALSFCAPDERSYLRDIEKLIKKQLVSVGGAPVASREAGSEPAPRRDSAPHGRRDSAPHGRGSRSQGRDSARHGRDAAPSRRESGQGRDVGAPRQVSLAADSVPPVAAPLQNGGWGRRDRPANRFAGR